MSDATSQEVLCRWATERFAIPAVKVDFDTTEGWFAGSDVTPPSPWVVEVSIVSATGKHYERTIEGHEVGAMIAEIVEVARRGS